MQLGFVQQGCFLKAATWDMETTTMDLSQFVQLAQRCQTIEDDIDDSRIELWNIPWDVKIQRGEVC